MFEKLIKPAEKQFRIKIYKLLQQHTNSIISRFKAIYIDKKEDKKTDEEEAEELSENITDNIYIAEGTQTMFKELLPLYLNIEEISEEFFYNIHYVAADNRVQGIINDSYLKWLDNYAATQIKRINRTTREETKRVIKDGLLQGKTYSEMAEDLQSDFKEYNKTRANTIASTECHNVFMANEDYIAKKTGFKYKKWISSRDASVRPSHQLLDGKIVKIDEEFKPGLAYPGDYRAPAKEVVRCRCVLKYLINKDD